MEPPQPPDRANLTSRSFRHLLVLTFLILLSLGLVPGLLQLETDNSPDVFFVDASALLDSYEEHRRTFGSDITLRLVVEGPRLWQKTTLAWLSELETQVSRLPGVLRVAGLPSHYRRFGWPPGQPDELRERAVANTLDRGAGWISANGRVTTLLVQIENLEPSTQADLLDRLNDLCENAPEGTVCRVLGLPVLNRQLDASSQEIQKVFFPVLVGFTILLLGWILRGVKRVLAPLIFVGLCQLLALGIMGYAGAELNMVLAVLPPLVFAISLATAVHLVLYLRRAPLVPSDDDVGSGVEGRIDSVFQEKRWAVLGTGVTTVVGFASLTLSPLSPVRALGTWAALALALTTASTFVFLPSLLSVLGFGSATASSWEGRWAKRGEALGRWARTRRKPTLVLACLISLVAIAGLPRLQSSSNALLYLAPDHPLRSGIERLEKNGIGIAALELIVGMPPSSGGAPPAFTSAIEVDRMADLGAELEKLDGVFGVVSVGSVLRDALQHVPTTPTNAHIRQQMALEGLRSDVEGRRILDALLAEDRLTAHATVFVETSDFQRLDQLTGRLREVASSHFPEAEIQTTGQYPLLLEAHKHLLSTLLTSLGMTLLAVACILRFLLPSTRLAFLALIPNLWPVLGTFGLMGWAGIPLDIASVMMASVVLGLAVDDSIHTLGHFRRLAPKVGSGAAVEKTLFATAPAYVLTALILVAGFGVCGFSDFAPIARFGGLSAFAIGLALIGDLLLLPALLSLTPDEVAARLGS